MKGLRWQNSDNFAENVSESVIYPWQNWDQQVVNIIKKNVWYSCVDKVWLYCHKILNFQVQAGEQTYKINKLEHNYTQKHVWFSLGSNMGHL